MALRPVALVLGKWWEVGVLKYSQTGRKLRIIAYKLLPPLGTVYRWQDVPLVVKVRILSLS